MKVILNIVGDFLYGLMQFTQKNGILGVGNFSRAVIIVAELIYQAKDPI